MPQMVAAVRGIGVASDLDAVVVRVPVRVGLFRVGAVLGLLVPHQAIPVDVVGDVHLRVAAANGEEGNDREGADHVASQVSGRGGS